MFHVFVEDMSLQYKEEHHALPGTEHHGMLNVYKFNCVNHLNKILVLAATHQANTNAIKETTYDQDYKIRSKSSD